VLAGLVGVEFQGAGFFCLRVDISGLLSISPALEVLSKAIPLSDWNREMGERCVSAMGGLDI
jgi:hypothetical protein